MGGNNDTVYSAAKPAVLIRRFNINLHAAVFLHFGMGYLCVIIQSQIRVHHRYASLLRFDCCIDLDPLLA